MNGTRKVLSCRSTDAEGLPNCRKTLTGVDRGAGFLGTESPAATEGKRIVLGVVDGDGVGRGRGPGTSRVIRSRTAMPVVEPPAWPEGGLKGISSSLKGVSPGDGGAGDPSSAKAENPRGWLDAGSMRH